MYFDILHNISLVSKNDTVRLLGRAGSFVYTKTSSLEAESGPDTRCPGAFMGFVILVESLSQLVH